MKRIAALYVEPLGVYRDLPGVDMWTEVRDARTYAGPHPVVAHPPCQRWGKFWHGSPRKPHQFKLGDDGGCFEAALASVREYGGVLEHPAYSKAWAAFGLDRPVATEGWRHAGDGIGHTCYVEQGHYGHVSNKGTWLYAARVRLPELIWGRGEQRLDPRAVERYGVKKASKIGMISWIGGKNKTAIRNATPVEFRDVLIAMARS